MMKKRREFFNSFVHQKNKEVVLRPPYYKDISLFAKECSKCEGLCATVCPEEIITITEDSTPILNFKDSGCSYCDECAKVCEFGVLGIEYKKLIMAKVSINIVKCLSWNGTMCFSCKDVCLDNAIEFLGLFRAEIDYDKCTNCGFCIGVCPVEAINLEGKK